MKEFIFAIQFIISQEHYYIGSRDVMTPVKGRIAITDKNIYFNIDSLVEEYPIIHIDHNKDYIAVRFKSEDITGTAVANKTIVKVNMVNGNVSATAWYTVKLTNYGER